MPNMGAMCWTCSRYGPPAGLPLGPLFDLSCALEVSFMLGPLMQAAILDWSKEYTGPKFDLVLACDVLYEVGIRS